MPVVLVQTLISQSGRWEIYQNTRFGFSTVPRGGKLAEVRNFVQGMAPSKPRMGHSRQITLHLPPNHMALLKQLNLLRLGTIMPRLQLLHSQIMVQLRQAQQGITMDSRLPTHSLLMVATTMVSRLSKAFEGQFPCFVGDSMY